MLKPFHHLLVGLLLLATPAAAAPGSSSHLADVEMTKLSGAKMSPGLTEGKVILVVNVASFCGYTNQYEDLQLLWKRYADRGLTLIGVPSDQFGQEPGSDREIKNFCETQYGVTFPLLQKQDVRGPTRSPLYDFLVENSGGDPVGWNFEKFLIGRSGKVIGRFPSFTVPLHPRMVAAIEMALDMQVSK
jgi:glutathione peroxidase